MAFHAESRAFVDETHVRMGALGAAILDPPAEYSAYTAGYYAVFFADPDGIKVEVAHIPQSNP